MHFVTTFKQYKRATIDLFQLTITRPKLYYTGWQYSRGRLNKNTPDLDSVVFKTTFFCFLVLLFLYHVTISCKRPIVRYFGNWSMPTNFPLTCTRDFLPLLEMVYTAYHERKAKTMVGLKRCIVGACGNAQWAYLLTPCILLDNF